VAFSPNSKTVASGSSDTTIRLWDIATDDTSQRLEGHDEEVTLVIFSPDGRIVASVSYDGTIKLWNADTGKERQKLKGHNDWARIVTFSPDGKIIASGSDDKTVRLWDVAIGEERRKLEGHDDCVSAVAFSPDGKTVASGSDDKTVRLWDVATGEERQKHQTSRSVSRIAFSRNGSSLETDVGQLDLGTTLNTYPPPVTEPQSILSLESTWIKYCGEDFLWLPHEYRGVCHDAYGTLLVIGQASGAVSFFSFK
jgi:WD40 repeat protein